MPKRDYWILVVLLFAVFLLQCVSSMSLKSATRDEEFYLISGQQLVNGSDWGTWTNIIHAPLTCYVHGFIVKLSGLEDFEAKLFLARIVMLWFAVLLGVVLLNWSRDLFGRMPSLFVLILYVFSPNMLAHARLITHDIPISAIGLASLYLFWKFACTGRLRYMLGSAVFTGIGLITKLAGVLFLPIYLVLFVVLCCVRCTEDRAAGKRGLRTAGITLSQWILFCAVAVFILNLGYLFKGSFILNRDNIWMSAFFIKLSKSLPGRLLFFVMPEPYLMGLDFQRYFSEYGFPAFFLGKFSMEGWWYFFPVVFLVKTPVPTLILIAGYLILSISKGKQALDKGKWVVAVPIIIYLLYFTVLNNFNIGLRHVLILYPLIFILLGGVFEYVLKKKMLLKTGFFAVLLWYLFDSFSIYPHYLAFANMFIGGPENGYKNLIDSNFEWGQDYKLARGYAQKSEKEVLFETDIPVEGRIVINSSRLNGYLSTVDKYKWLRSLEPVDKIGYTWLVYDVDANSLELLVKANPKDMELYYALTSIYMTNKDYDKAAKTIETGLSVDDTSAKLHYLAGKLDIIEKQQDKALEDLQKAVSLDPKLAEAFEYTAFIYEVRGEREKSDRATKDMMISASRRSYFKTPEYSFSYYEKILKEAPDDFRAFNNLGFLYWASDDDKKALEMFNKAIEINPVFADAYSNLAYVLEEKGRLDEALKVRARYIDLLRSTDSYQEPRVFFDGVIMCNGIFVIQQMPISEEERYLNMLKKKIMLRDKPEDYALCHDIAVDYMWLKKSALSLRYAKKSIEINKDFSQGYVTAAVLYGEKGFFDMAKESWRNMTQIGKE